MIESIQGFMKQPALSVGEFLFFCLVIFLFWGGVFIALFVESVRPAAAQQLAEDVLFRVDSPASPADDGRNRPGSPGLPAEDEKMMRDFGLVPEPPLDLTPVRIEYSGAPLPVVVGVGTERRLVFEQPFRIGLEPAVAGFFQLEIYGRHLLLEALRPVSTRIRVQLASGLVIPLDVRAVIGAGPAGPLEIAAAPPAPAGEDEELVVPVSVLPHPALAPDYVDLARHAAQRLYAPERLWTERPGMRSVPVSREAVRLIRGVHVEASPVAAWEEGGLIVTAVRIDNLEKRTIRLDPRNVVGHWRAAAFQHGLLRPRAATAVYLISDVPFESALGIYGAVARASATDEPVPTPSTKPVSSGLTTEAE